MRKAPGHKFWPEKVFPTKKFPPHMCSQNDQCDMGIILSHIWWGGTPPPPPGGMAVSPPPPPPRRTRSGGRWEICLRAPPTPWSDFLLAQPWGKPHFAVVKGATILCTVAQSQSSTERLNNLLKLAFGDCHWCLTDHISSNEVLVCTMGLKLPDNKNLIPRTPVLWSIAVGRRAMCPSGCCWKGGRGSSAH